MALTTTITSLIRHWASVRTLCPVALCATFSCTAIADDSIFIPSDLKSNLKSSNNERSSAYPDINTLCNKGLAKHSEMIRSNKMSATHRALNYDWLASYSEDGRQYHGGRAAGRIAQQMLRQYWDHKRRELGDNALLNEKGSLMREYNGIDYGFSASGGGLNFGFNYTFE